MAGTERPIGAVVDHLVDRYSQDTSRLAIVGMSGGGYLVSGAVMTERRLAVCVARTPVSDMGQFLPIGVVRAMATEGAMRDSFRMYLWRSGCATPEEFAELLRTAAVLLRRALPSDDAGTQYNAEGGQPADGVSLRGPS
ncbi:prolyl oligopeptidase family serine peptidase, partial [Nonomuraea sp. RK-328]|nr:prolyl oligopeptidase family serine peptidase [Nonomuraea sp. RK-328]